MPYQLTRDRMPVCSNFLRGQCFDDECRYAHVRVARDAPICAEFQEGHCSRGEACKFRHTYARVGAVPSSSSAFAASASSSSAGTVAPSSLRQATRPATALASAGRLPSSSQATVLTSSIAESCPVGSAGSRLLKRSLPGVVATISAADGGATEADAGDRSAKVAKAAAAEIPVTGATAASIFPSFLRRAAPTDL